MPKILHRTAPNREAIQVSQSTSTEKNNTCLLTNTITNSPVLLGNICYDNPRGNGVGQLEAVCCHTLLGSCLRASLVCGCSSAGSHVRLAGRFGLGQMCFPFTCSPLVAPNLSLALSKSCKERRKTKVSAEKSLTRPCTIFSLHFVQFIA